MAIDTGTVIGVFGLAFGVFMYFTSGILKDKAKLIEHEVKIKNLEDRVDRIEDNE